jgi:hypothetical protein
MTQTTKTTASPEPVKLYTLRPGDRFKFEDGSLVYTVGRADGACVHVVQVGDAANCGPVYAWNQVIPVTE